MRNHKRLDGEQQCFRADKGVSFRRRHNRGIGAPVTFDAGGVRQILVDCSKRRGIGKIGNAGKGCTQVVQIAPERFAGGAGGGYILVTEIQRRGVRKRGPVGKPSAAVAVADNLLGKFDGQNAIRIDTGADTAEMLLGEAAHLGINPDDPAFQLDDTPLAVGDVTLGRPSIEGSDFRGENIDGCLKLLERFAFGGQEADRQVANPFRDLVPQNGERAFAF